LVLAVEGGASDFAPSSRYNIVVCRLSALADKPNANANTLWGAGKLDIVTSRFQNELHKRMVQSSTGCFQSSLFLLSLLLHMK